MDSGAARQKSRAAVPGTIGCEEQATHSAEFCLVREENGNALPGGSHPPIPSGCTATLGHLKRDQISLIDQGPNIRKEKLVVVTRLLGRGIAAKDRAHEFRLAVDDDPAPDT
jgi:hypothetical protein